MTALLSVKGIGEKTLEKLNSLGIFSLEDLIGTLPKSYLDLSNASQTLFEAETGAFCVVEVVVVSVKPPIKRGRLTVTRITAQCLGEKVNLIWFNQPYVAKVLKVGDVITVCGKLAENLEFHNPNYEKKSDGESRFSGIQPIYRTKGIFTQYVFHGFIEEGLKNVVFDSVISENVEKELNLIDLKSAYFAAHLPKSIEEGKAAKSRIVLEHIVKRIAAYRYVREFTDVGVRRNSYPISDFSPFLKSLPFDLTSSQREALTGLASKLKSKKKLNAALCGDVGSGKTVIALALAYIAVKNGYQVALMAPTELLAFQHYKTAQRLFESLNVSCALLVGRQKKAEREELCRGLSEGLIDLAVGTHAVISKNTEFKKLGLVVCDEQHRFGVGQRTALLDKGENADVLMLSATPIPRSMQLSAYGDLDFYTIEKRQYGNIKTAIVYPEKRIKLFEYIAAECKKGKQAYVVAPMIEDVEGIETTSVKELYDELKKGVFKDISVGLLHGKMGDEKQRVLDGFAENTLSVLISTTVVEVGIDVQNASIIAIMDADRFGLATLHQLRGRVGRDGKTAYCFLYTKDIGNERLKYMVETEDGFKLAEKDFEMRGGGEVFGLAQSGAGNIEGLTQKTLKEAKKIVDRTDLNAIAGKLSGEIEKFSLKSVSLT